MMNPAEHDDFVHKIFLILLQQPHAATPGVDVTTWVVDLRKKAKLIAEAYELV